MIGKRAGDAPLVEVDIGLLADDVGVAATDTLDLRQGVHDLALAVNISVEQTQDVLRVVRRLSLAQIRSYAPGTAGGPREQRETS